MVPKCPKPDGPHLRLFLSRVACQFTPAHRCQASPDVTLCNSDPERLDDGDDFVPTPVEEIETQSV